MANADGPRLGGVKQVSMEKGKACLDLLTDSNLGVELPESLSHPGLNNGLEPVHEMLGQLLFNFHGDLLTLALTLQNEESNTEGMTDLVHERLEKGIAPQTDSAMVHQSTTEDGKLLEDKSISC